MTPAVNALTKAKISFALHEYIHDSQVNSYGDEASDCLNISKERVFKTLVASVNALNNSKDLVIAIVPVSGQLDLKALAKSLSVKKATMADSTAAQKATGYVLGGISPFGQKKRLPCRLDSSAQHFDTIYVSGGKRGLEIELAPSDLLQMCHSQYADIKKTD